MLMLGTPSREAAAKGGSVADWRRPIQENERLPTRLRAAIPTPIGAFRSAPQMEKSHEPHGHLAAGGRSEEHTSELQSLMRISYAVFCLKKKNNNRNKKYI